MKIGDLDLGARPLLLAPMEDVTDLSFRYVCKKFGADMMYTEFISSDGLIRDVPGSLYKLRIFDYERPIGMQIYGHIPEAMVESAVRVEAARPDVIDINFGCPAPNATHAGAGSALLKNPKQMCAIVSAVAGILKRTPLTAKMRTGWDGRSIIVPDAAQALADSGAQMITLHGRTKARGYEGDADWDLIEKTARAVSVPLIGNGSVEKLSAERLRNSACAGFMIGRAALGNPWIFQAVRAKLGGGEYFEPSSGDRARLALRYAQIVSGGGYSGIDTENLAHAKVQIMRFLKNSAGFKKLRVALKNINTLDELKNLLCDYI